MTEGHLLHISPEPLYSFFWGSTDKMTIFYINIAGGATAA